MATRTGLMAPLLLAGLLFLPACGTGGSETDGSLPPDEASLTAVQLLGQADLRGHRPFRSRAGKRAPRVTTPHGRSRATTALASAAVSLGSRPEVFGNRNAPTAMYATVQPRASALVAEPDDQRHDRVHADGRTVLGWPRREPGRAGHEAVPEPARDEQPERGGGDRQSPRRAPTPTCSVPVYGADAFDDVGCRLRPACSTRSRHSRKRPGSIPFSSKFDDFLRGKAHARSGRGARIRAVQGSPRKATASPATSATKAPDTARLALHRLHVRQPRHPTKRADPRQRRSDLLRPRALPAGRACREGAASQFDVGSLCGAFKVPTLRNVELHRAVRAQRLLHHAARRGPLLCDARHQPRALVSADRCRQRRRSSTTCPPEYRANVNTEEVPYDRKPGEPPRLERRRDRCRRRLPQHPHGSLKRAPPRTQARNPTPSGDADATPREHRPAIRDFDGRSPY